MNTIALPNQSISDDVRNATRWTEYFSIGQAMHYLHVHLGTKLSDKTPEKHTRRNYERGIWYFLGWASGINIPEGKLTDGEKRYFHMMIKQNMAMPNEQLLTQFISHLLHEKEWGKGQTVNNGVSAQTVANNYLAPIRIFIKGLIKQQINVTGYEREFVIDCKEIMRVALTEVKNPRAVEEDNTVWNPKFNVMTMVQVNSVLKSFDRDTLAGARNYAICRMLIESAFRASEVLRVTQNKIAKQATYQRIKVRRKGQNNSPVAVTNECIDAVNQWVEMYNDGLSLDDPRRITPDTPIFQPLTSGGNRFSLDRVYNPDIHSSDKHRLVPENGLSYSALKLLSQSVTKKVLGFKVNPHSWRRSYATINMMAGTAPTDIQKGMGHKDLGMSMKYVCPPPNLEGTLMSNVMTIA